MLLFFVLCVCDFCYFLLATSFLVVRALQQFLLRDEIFWKLHRALSGNVKMWHRPKWSDKKWNSIYTCVVEKGKRPPCKKENSHIDGGLLQQSFSQKLHFLAQIFGLSPFFCDLLLKIINELYVPLSYIGRSRNIWDPTSHQMIEAQKTTTCNLQKTPTIVRFDQYLVNNRAFQGMWRFAASQLTGPTWVFSGPSRLGLFL